MVLWMMMSSVLEYWPVDQHWLVGLVLTSGWYWEFDYLMLIPELPCKHLLKSSCAHLRARYPRHAFEHRLHDWDDQIGFWSDLKLSR